MRHKLNWLFPTKSFLYNNSWNSGHGDQMSKTDGLSRPCIKVVTD
jgi:hypothetical protein